MGIPIQSTSAAEEAIRNSDLICTATSSRDSVIQSDWVSPGTHINAVGACFPTTRELDTATIVRSRLFVDRIESAMNEAGDFLIPKQEGAIDDNHILGEVETYCSLESKAESLLMKSPSLNLLELQLKI